MSKPKILVLCTGNSCRSQMAEGYLRLLAGERAEVRSAGIEAHGVNPLAVATMFADGVDISQQTSNRVEEYAGIDFDLVLTVCDNARERCPVLPTKAKKLHHSFPDPAKATGTAQEVAAQFAAVREQIKAYCAAVVAEYL